MKRYDIDMYLFNRTNKKKLNHIKSYLLNMY